MELIFEEKLLILKVVGQDKIVVVVDGFFVEVVGGTIGVVEGHLDGGEGAEMKKMLGYG